MEPADPAQLQQKLGQWDALLESQQQQLFSIMQCVQNLTHQMATLSTTVQATQPSLNAWFPTTSTTDPGSAPPLSAPRQANREPQLPPPERYDGSPGECRAFLTQYQLIFQLQPQTFPTDKSRVAYIITQLIGKARKWGTATWSADMPCIWSSQRFMQEMQRVFDWHSTGLEAGRELMRLWQGKRSVSDYSINFQTLVTDSGWEGLIYAFLHELSESVKD